MYVRQQHVKNFRCFADTVIEFQMPAGQRLDNISLVLGDNGTGKSSLLRAMALTALSDVIGQSGFFPRHLVRRGNNDSATLSAELQVDHQDDPSLSDGTTSIHLARATIRRRGQTERIEGEPAEKEIEGLYYDDNPSFFILGYGATRRVDMTENFDPQSQKRDRLSRYQRIAGLFEDHIAMVPMHSWFRNIDDARRSEIIELVNRLLPSQLQFTGDWEDNELLFVQEDGPIPFSALSDGYRGFIGLIGDILYHLNEVSRESASSLTSVSGLVMIDEIDLHLHPSWQRSVGPTFSETFPKLQFIFTSHSPIVVGTVDSNNVIVLDFDSEDTEIEDPWPRVVALRLGENVHGLNSDQILVSPYFGLNTTRAPDAEKVRRDLEMKAALGDQAAAVEYLTSLSKKPAL